MSRWTLIPWDGNPALGFKCYRKTFNNGHVSVGIGAFDSVVFSYGANSDASYTATRGKRSPQSAMRAVDAGKGKKLIWVNAP